MIVKNCRSVWANCPAVLRLSKSAVLQKLRLKKRKTVLMTLLRATVCP